MGLQVKSFPDGISEAFEGLMNQLPDGKSRVYYGIAWCINNKMTYIAAAEEKSDEEAKKFGLQRYEIERGVYLAKEIKNWRLKVATIKDVFAEMDKDERIDKLKPSIEIYENEETMWCLAKVAEGNSSQIQGKEIEKSRPL